MAQVLKNPHPGEILQEDFLEPLGLSQNALAQLIDVPANRINEIIRGRRGITADTDLRLARFFGLSEGYWLRLQNAFDVMEVKRSDISSIDKIKRHQAISKPTAQKRTVSKRAAGKVVKKRLTLRRKRAA